MTVIALSPLKPFFTRISLELGRNPVKLTPDNRVSDFSVNPLSLVHIIHISTQIKFTNALLRTKTPLQISGGSGCLKIIRRLHERVERLRAYTSE